MQKNFTIDQSIEVLNDGSIYDLHNRFDFGDLSISSGRAATLLLRPHEEYGKGLPTIQIEAIDVDFLELSEGFGTRDLPGIEELGYKYPNDRDLDWLMTEYQAKPDDHLVVRFSAEDYIRFHAREVLLTRCSGVVD